MPAVQPPPPAAVPGPAHSEQAWYDRVMPSELQASGGGAGGGIMCASTRAVLLVALEDVAVPPPGRVSISFKTAWTACFSHARYQILLGMGSMMGAWLSGG